MSDLQCAKCGEEEELRGEKVDDVITITCEACGLVWDRDLKPSCPTCGSDDVRAAFQAVVEKSRGTQLSFQTMRLLYLCRVCDKERLAAYQVSNRPLPPDEMPIDMD